MRVPLPWLAILLFAWLPMACSSGDTVPTELQLRDLTRFTEQYDGEKVATAGTVRSFADPEHYWIEDDDLNRVAVHPDSAVSDLVGQRVRITGRFHYSRESGRSIDAEKVTPVQH